MAKSKRILSISLVILLLVTAFLSACNSSSGDSGSSQASSQSSAADSSIAESAGSESDAGSEESSAPAAADVPGFDDIQFPESLPSGIIMAEDGMYDYDDLTERYDIEIMLTNYGEQPYPADQDPVNQWISSQFNMDISLSAPATADYETTLSARFAADDVPDLLMLPTDGGKQRDYGFTLSDQGLLVDARNIYPYMTHSNKYTTQTMIKWSTNPNNGEIPFLTKYSIQDASVWGLAIRKDWLEKFGMEYPTTKDELMAYAKACTFEDPDGNGQNDTYFMTGNGNGRGWGMLDQFATMYGNPSAYAEGGQLQHQYFNGTRKAFLTLLSEFYNEGVLAPDWYTLDWEPGRALVANDKVGMVRWPVGALYQQYSKEDKQESLESLEVWDYWADPPIEGGRYNASGEPGFLWAFPKSKYGGEELDVAKIKRVAHMLDSMAAGNINYFQTIQGSVDEVFEAAGVPLEGHRIMEYTDDGLFYVNNPGLPPYTSESGRRQYEIWQQFGLCVTYQIDYADPSDPYLVKYAERTEQMYKIVNQEYPRWENTALLVSLSGAAAEAQVTNNDWVLAQEYAFVTGGRSLDDYDTFCQEWLDKGGKAIIEQTAEQLGVPVPDYAQ